VVHVGFAIAKLNMERAKDILATLENLTIEQRHADN
jgi:hydrogenase maturation factor